MLVLTFLLIDGWRSCLKTWPEGGMKNSKANFCEEMISPCFAWGKNSLSSHQFPK